MAFIHIQNCLEDPSFLNNRFILTSVAARRSNDLLQVMDRPMVESSYRKMTNVALEEILTGKLKAIQQSPSMTEDSNDQ
ncbi:DNA-directed RNA polymerase subunit omega [Desulfurispira natronophila]|uniref:DNA-directed RNA polymerase subunit omega n=1 Tax=Desulfurispira natronophila TaxID=682562 RepID=A0A7W7Y2T2_9BACT|nr:DNA-directed RNA polymerase subunit omega [Desulfurispira natronophila]MBB5021021.1 DNA-directed RNA polymerase omega subunit [Desulfurispira natronophila]